MTEPAATPLAYIPYFAVDDEPLALALVCAFIEQTPFSRLAGRYASAVAALNALHKQPKVQLLFLDIKMSDLSGIELARVLLGNGPRVIFTTAFNHYALDYLLKPFNYKEFLRAALKARAYFGAGAGLASAPKYAQAPAPPQDHFYLEVEYPGACSPIFSTRRGSRAT